MEWLQASQLEVLHHWRALHRTSLIIDRENDVTGVRLAMTVDLFLPFQPEADVNYVHQFPMIETERSLNKQLSELKHAVRF